MSDDLKSHFAQTCAWFSVVLGGLTFEMWLALAGLAISAFISWTNYRSRKYQDRLLAEQAERQREHHEMEKERLTLLRQYASLRTIDHLIDPVEQPEAEGRTG